MFEPELAFRERIYLLFFYFFVVDNRDDHCR